jgi:hypothetical protein
MRNQPFHGAHRSKPARGEGCGSMKRGRDRILSEKGLGNARVHAMKHGDLLVTVLLIASCAGQTRAAEAPTIPPSVASINPHGMRRGSTVVFTVEGRNIAGTQWVLFDVPGLAAKVLEVRDVPEEAKVTRPGVDLGAAVPEGTKQQAKLELTAAPEVEVGPHWFRLQTSLGTSNMAIFEVDSLPQVQEVEPNDTPAQSQRVELPAALVGTLSSAGDVDTYQFQGQAGKEVVFQPLAASLGSPLQSVLTLRDSNGQVLARAGEFSRNPEAVLIAKLPVDGWYTIAISDLEKKGGWNYFYRLKAGALPYVTEVFPLGTRTGEAAEVAVKGVNLDEVRTVKVEPAAYEGPWQTIPLRVKTAQGEALNKVRLAVGEVPEVVESEPNNSPAQAQRISIPVTINGHIASASAKTPDSAVRNSRPADEDFFRFAARKDQHLNIEVQAARLGSPLDSVVEVLDGDGREIPQATLRSIAQTTLTLNDRDSRTRFFRLESLAGLHPNDYLMMGDELVQIDFVPDQPDADIRVKGLGKERFSLLNTSPEAHSQTDPVYKVRVFGPGREFPPNGMPVFQLTLRNDDGGPGYGSDSHLDFVVPRDGEYLVHIKDVRGQESEDFAYRLTVREAYPDFMLSADPGSPNVPRGGRIPVVVTADRREGFDGPIEVDAQNLPPGVKGIPATIASGQYSTVLILEVPETPSGRGATDAEPGRATPFQIVGRGKVGGRVLIRVADAEEPLRVVSVMPSPDVIVAARPQQVELEAGKEVTVTLQVDRRNGFKGRIPCAVANLPPGVTVVNSGLNGVLVTENQNTRTFTLRAEDWVETMDQPIYVVAEVESNSPTRHASAPLVLKVRGKKMIAGGGSGPLSR